MFEDTAAQDVAERDVGVSSNGGHGGRHQFGQPDADRDQRQAVDFPSRDIAHSQAALPDGGTGTENRRAGSAGR
jgi:hypothetical protein